jgi:hypothetical protein
MRSNGERVRNSTEGTLRLLLPFETSSICDKLAIPINHVTAGF